MFFFFVILSVPVLLFFLPQFDRCVSICFFLACVLFLRHGARVIVCVVCGSLCGVWCVSVQVSECVCVRNIIRPSFSARLCTSSGGRPGPNFFLFLDEFERLAGMRASVRAASVSWLHGMRMRLSDDDDDDDVDDPHVCGSSSSKSAGGRMCMLFSFISPAAVRLSTFF